jgi:predicted permease
MRSRSTGASSHIRLRAPSSRPSHAVSSLLYAELAAIWPDRLAEPGPASAAQIEALAKVSPGFDPEHVLTFQVSSNWGETADMPRMKRRVMRMLDGFAALPGVESSAVGFLPGVPSEFQLELKVEEGRAETEPKVIAQGRTISPGYFATLKIPVLAGELCREEANVAAIMVNRAFVNAYFPSESPIGKHLSQPGSLYITPGVIRGVVGDAREMGLDKAPVPTAYWCYYPGQPGTHFLLRTKNDPRAMSETIRRATHDLEPLRSVFDMAPLTDQISDAYAENRLRAILIAFFAGAAVLLACIGLYGTISYTVAMRKREVGLRLALGAMRTRIAGQFLSQGAVVAAIGCIAGIAMALGLARLISGMLYGVSATDPMTLSAVVAGVLAVAVIASLIPAIRAARLDPMHVLRED